MGGLMFYSLGIVSEDKPRNNNQIKVTPIEHLSMSVGRLKDQKQEYNVNLPDHQGVKRQEQMKGDVSLVAFWLPFGNPNRATPPDVIEGETVMIWKYSDVDEYFWTTLMFEPSIRRQETVCYMFGNVPKGLQAFTKDTSYWMEVSTHDKYIQLHTANNDGEPFVYDVKIDTAAGTVTITDDVGNNIVLDSTNNKLTVNTNVDVEVNTQNAVVNASTKVDVNTATATVNASDSVNINTPITKISDDVEIGGNVKVGGAMEIGQGLSTGAGGSGDTKIGGEIKIEGNVQGTGNIDVSGNIQAGGSIHGSNI